MVLLKAPAAARILLLLSVLVSSCFETATVHGFVSIPRGMVGIPRSTTTAPTTTSLPVLPWRRFQKQNDQEPSSRNNNSNSISIIKPKSRRQKIWRHIVAVVIAVAAARRGFIPGAAHANTVDEVWMTSVVTSKPLQQPTVPPKALPSPKAIRGAVLVAAGAGAVLGWNLVQIEKPSPAVQKVGVREDGDDEDNASDISSPPPSIIESIQEVEDEKSRLRAQKFVEGVLGRIKDAQRNAFRTMSPSTPSSSVPEVGSASYLESLSSSTPSVKTAPLISSKPVTPKQPPVGTSYLDSLATKFSRVGQEVAAAAASLTTTSTTETVEEVKPIVVETTTLASSSSTRPRRTTTTLVTGTNPLKSWSVIKRQRKFEKARQQPKPPAEEEVLAQKYASLSVPDRAYQILVDLGMVEPTGDGSSSSDDDSEAEA